MFILHVIESASVFNSSDSANLFRNCIKDSLVIFLVDVSVLIPMSQIDQINPKYLT